MSLIIVKNKTAAPLHVLVRLVLKYIYEKERMKPEDVRLMQESVVRWKEKLECDRHIGREREHERFILENLAVLLKKDEEGRFEDRKRLFREKGIDYHKFHRLPESYRPGDFVRAQAEFEKLKKLNPEENA